MLPLDATQVYQPAFALVGAAIVKVAVALPPIAETELTLELVPLNLHSNLRMVWAANPVAVQDGSRFTPWIAAGVSLKLNTALKLIDTSVCIGGNMPRYLPAHFACANEIICLLCANAQLHSANNSSGIIRCFITDVLRCMRYSVLYNCLTAAIYTYNNYAC